MKPMLTPTLRVARQAAEALIARRLAEKGE